METIPGEMPTEHHANKEILNDVNNSISDEEEEEDECRVCRGPAEEGRPLYTPCKCAGSIGCVHQDCLLSWLEVTRGTKCELCSTQFKFAPKYADNTPDNLPPLEVLSGVLHRAGKKWIPFILRVLLAATLWLCALPLATAYLYFGWLHRPSSLVPRLKTEYIASDTVSGALVATVIVVSFLSLMSFADFLRIHWQQVNRRREDDEHVEDGIENDLAEEEEDVQEDVDSDDEEDADVGAGLHRMLRPQQRFNARPEDILNFDMDVVGFDNEEDDDNRRNEEQDNANLIRRQQELRNNLAMPNVPRVNDPLRQNNRANRRPDPAVDQDDGMEMEIHMALDELLGIRGPISALFRNLMWLLAFNTTYLGLFAFIPHTVGVSVNSALSNSLILKFIYSHIPKTGLSLDSMQAIITSLNAESRRLNTLLQLPDLATIVLGYLSMACMVFLWKGATSVVLSIMQFIAQKRRRTPASSRLRDRNDIIHNELDRVRAELGQVREELDRVREELQRVDGNGRGRIPHRLSVVLECAAAIVKVGILLFLKMLLLPLLLGIWLDTATLPLFSATQEKRILFTGADLFSSLLLHWVVGITFMLLVTVSVLQLREVVHPELLAKAIRPQEPQPDLLGNLLQESGSTHAKRMLLSLGIYALLLSIHIWLPSTILVKSGIGSMLPFFQPHINYLFLPKLQIPIELLIFHLSVLACLEKYKNQIGNTQHRFLLFLCEKMNITDFILPRSVEKFKLVGSLPIYKEVDSPSDSSDVPDNSDHSPESEKEKVQEALEVYPLWKELSKNSNPSDEYIMKNINLVESNLPIRYETGITKRGGQRSLHSAPAVLSINGKTLDNIRLPSKVGGYRLRRTRKDKKDVIEFWREVVGEAIPRPPEGWDDLGVGGAEVQGRWAWGNEKRSEIEEGVAKRKQFKESKRYSFLLVKLLFLLIVSWVGVFVIVCAGLNTPLIIGRIFFHLLQVPDCYKHDPYGAVIGLATMYLSSKLTSNVNFDQFDRYSVKVKDWVSSYISPASKSKANVLLLTLVLWLVISPTLLGVMYDMCFIMTRDRWTGETRLLTIKSCAKGWLSGSLMLNVWMVMCYFGAFSQTFWQGLIMNVNENNANNENEANANIGRQWQGKNGRINNFISRLISIISGWEWDQVDSSVLLGECMLPIAKEIGLLFCGSLLGFVAYIYSFPSISSATFLINIVPSLAEIGFYRMAVFRIIAGFMLTTRLSFACHSMLHHWFKAAHRAARDDRYLVGEVLMDYVPDNNE